MPVIFPKHCRNVTAGALREVMRHGVTTASGGLVQKKVLGRKDLLTKYFCDGEPAGEFMEHLENTKRLLDENTEAVLASGRQLVEAAKASNKDMVEVTRSFREGTERLGVAIEKLLRIAGKPEFAETVRLAESLASSMERLAVLEDRGLLNRVMQAMKS